MTLETALPQEAQASQASDQQSTADALDTTNELQQTAEGQTEGEGGEKAEGDPPKKEKTPEQREIERLRRVIDRRTKHNYELRAQLSQQPVTPQRETAAIAPSQAQDEPVTLSRAELEKVIKERAEQLAPQIRTQQAEIEHRQKVVAGMAKEWGQEKFDAYASELDDVLGGLQDRSGRAKPITDAIFESEMPAAVVQYLTDPENAAEAESLAGLNDRQAARAIAKIEAKLAAAPKKPERSNAPAPIEGVRAAGKAASAMPDPANTKAYIKWANEQEYGKR